MAAPAGIQVLGCEPWDGRFRVTFAVVNLESAPLVLRDAWIPHGRFRGEGHVPLEVHLAAGEEYRLTLRVTANEAPGTVVENAFLILRADALRIFVRMRIEFADAPTPIVEAVTAQCLQWTAMPLSDDERYVMQRMRGWFRNWSGDFEETTGMVSSTLGLDEEWLRATLERLRTEHGDDPEYVKWRADFPSDWPV